MLCARKEAAARLFSIETAAAWRGGCHHRLRIAFSLNASVRRYVFSTAA
jgi:hypothetical protein